MRLVYTSLLAPILFVLFFCGIGRDDVPRSRYVALAAAHEFDCVGRVLHDGSPAGSCVLIGSHYVLSAAHIFIARDGTKVDTVVDHGVTMYVNTAINEHVGNAAYYSVQFDGHSPVRLKSLVVYPAYLGKETKGSGDLVLLELAEDVAGIVPATVNAQLNELHDTVTGVGYGVSGPAYPPDSVGMHQEKIAGQNIVDTIVDDRLGGAPTILECDFDRPNDASCNKMGSPVPLDMEYMCGGGDSGGGLFRRTARGPELIGICSGFPVNIQQLMKTGYYGQIMKWTRLAPFHEWLEQSMRGQ